MSYVIWVLKEQFWNDVSIVPTSDLTDEGQAPKVVQKFFKSVLWQKSRINFSLKLYKSKISNNDKMKQ